MVAATGRFPVSIIAQPVNYYILCTTDQRRKMCGVFDVEGCSTARIRVMSYNIGHYNMGLSPFGYPPDVMDDKVTNLKEMLMEYGPDIIGLQEDSEYADQAKTKKSSKYLYSPVWRYRPSNGGSNIRAKYAAYAGTGELCKFSSGRNYKKAVLKVNGKRLLMISAHPTAHEGNSEIRKQEYTELFDAVHRETWDWCVIAGDFNTLEKADKANLKALCSENSFDMAIGSYLPWVTTFLGRTAKAKHHSFDNILTSPGVTILTVRVLRDWWDRLYSDHVPVVCTMDLG